MLEHEINLEMLNLFDLVTKSSEYCNYHHAEKVVLDDYQLLIMINEYNDLSAQSSLEANGQKRLSELKKKIDDNPSYYHYLDTLRLYQIMVERIGQIIFQDIITISKEGEGCACQ